MKEQLVYSPGGAVHSRFSETFKKRLCSISVPSWIWVKQAPPGVKLLYSPGGRNNDDLWTVCMDRIIQWNSSEARGRSYSGWMWSSSVLYILAIWLMVQISPSRPRPLTRIDAKMPTVAGSVFTHFSYLFIHYVCFLINLLFIYMVTPWSLLLEKKRINYIEMQLALYIYHIEVLKIWDFSALECPMTSQLDTLGHWPITVQYLHHVTMTHLISICWSVDEVKWPPSWIGVKRAPPVSFLP